MESLVPDLPKQLKPRGFEEMIHMHGYIPLLSILVLFATDPCFINVPTRFVFSLLHIIK
jgi:hypothetical protein